MQTPPVAGFAADERAYIRNELDVFFSTLPTVAEGFQLKTWRGGPEAGKPKLSPVAKGLLQRGLMRLDTSQRLPRLFFTEAGLAELRTMMADRRFADPKKVRPYPPGTRHRSHAGGRVTVGERLRRGLSPILAGLEAKGPGPVAILAGRGGPVPVRCRMAYPCRGSRAY